MPMDRSKYCRDWEKISRDIRDAAGNRCQWCRVHNYAVGYREEDGQFVPCGGNLVCDAAGWGQHENGEPLTYSEAREFTEQYNCCTDGRDDDGKKWIVIVLTVAHLDNDTTNNDSGNLAALCQRCHNRHDVEYRRGNRARTALAKKAAGSLFPEPATTA